VSFRGIGWLFALILSDVPLDASHYPMSIRNIAFRIVSHRVAFGRAANPATRGSLMMPSTLPKAPEPAGGAVPAASGRLRVGRRIADHYSDVINPGAVTFTAPELGAAAFAGDPRSVGHLAELNRACRHWAP
jgi:hypothetical protein